jgi:hypothetical protein
MTKAQLFTIGALLVLAYLGFKKLAVANAAAVANQTKNGQIAAVGTVGAAVVSILA